MWTTDDIDRVSDPGSVERGRRYAAEGRVMRLHASSSQITATVSGTVPYAVHLTPSDWSCDCPVGIDGWFCKHCVAVAIAASSAHAQRPGPGTGDGHDVEPAPRPRAPDERGAKNAPRRPSPWAPSRQRDGDDLRAWLDRQDVATLADLVEALIDRHPEILPDVLARAATDAADPQQVKELVSRSLATRKRHLDWRESVEWAGQAQLAVDALASLVDSGRPEAVAMIQRAASRVVRVILKSDDSSGAVGDVAGQLLDLHERACRSTPPPTKKLVAWLLEFGVDEQDFFTLDVDHYAATLGDEGVSAYREEIERRLRTTPPGPLGPPFALTRAQERLAVIDGDLDRLTKLVGGDLNNPQLYLRVVTTLQEIGADDEAFAWAKRALIEHGDDHGGRLSAYAVDRHLARGETEEALTIRREGLRKRPDAQRYAALRATANAVAPDTWGGEREAAIETLRAGPPTELVRALVAEGATDEAWEASQGVAMGLQLATDLADLIAAAQPTEAIWLLGGAVNAVLQNTGERSYRDAIALLRRMRTIARSAGLEDVLGEFVSGLAERNKRRPTFMAKLRKAGYLS